MTKEVVLFGGGKIAQELYKNSRDINIVAVIDNHKTGTWKNRKNR